MVLRTVFAGIGQLLMAADKVRARLQEQLVPEPPHHPPAGQPEAGRQQPAATGNVTLLSDRQGAAARPKPAKPATTTAVPAGQAPAKPAPAKTATARGTADTPEPAKRTAAKPAATRPKPAKPAATRPNRAKPAAAKPATASPTAPKPTAPKPATAKPATTPAAGRAPVPPVAGYDSLSVASLRARLRGLDPGAVRALLDYERATARRHDVITMYERRLARLAGETG